MIEENNPQKSESETVQPIEKTIEAEKVTVKPKGYTCSKTRKEKWDSARLSFEAGNFTSLKELAERFGIHPKTFYRRIENEGWKEKKEQILRNLERKIEERKEKELSKADSWKEKVWNRSQKDWQIVDNSMDGLGDQADPEAICGYVRSRKILDDMVRRTLGMLDPSVQVDVKSGGLSIAENLILAIERLRGDASTPRLTEEDAKRVLELDVADEET